MEAKGPPGDETDFGAENDRLDQGVGEAVDQCRLDGTPVRSDRPGCHLRRTAPAGSPTPRPTRSPARPGPWRSAGGTRGGAALSAGTPCGRGGWARIVLAAHGAHPPPGSAEDFADFMALSALWPVHQSLSLSTWSAVPHHLPAVRLEPSLAGSGGCRDRRVVFD